MGELCIFIYFTFTGPSGLCNAGSEQNYSASIVLHVRQVEHRDHVDIWKLWADKSKNQRIMISENSLGWKGPLRSTSSKPIPWAGAPNERSTQSFPWMCMEVWPFTLHPHLHIMAHHWGGPPLQNLEKTMYTEWFGTWGRAGDFWTMSCGLSLSLHHYEPLFPFFRLLGEARNEAEGLYIKCSGLLATGWNRI